MDRKQQITVHTYTRDCLINQLTKFRDKRRKYLGSQSKGKVLLLQTDLQWINGDLAKLQSVLCICEMCVSVCCGGSGV